MKERVAAEGRRATPCGRARSPRPNPQDPLVPAAHLRPAARRSSTPRAPGGPLPRGGPRPAPPTPPTPGAPAESRLTRVLSAAPSARPSARGAPRPARRSLPASLRTRVPPAPGPSSQGCPRPRGRARPAVNSAVHRPPPARGAPARAGRTGHLRSVLAASERRQPWVPLEPTGIAWVLADNSLPRAAKLRPLQDTGPGMERAYQVEREAERQLAARNLLGGPEPALRNQGKQRASAPRDSGGPPHLEHPPARREGPRATRGSGQLCPPPRSVRAAQPPARTRSHGRSRPEPQAVNWRRGLLAGGQQATLGTAGPGVRCTDRPRTPTKLLRARVPGDWEQALGTGSRPRTAAGMEGSRENSLPDLEPLGGKVPCREPP
ncbi:translation initiation factor IF-2-like [Echinops telfairi]|uniref:Translation initiation factor IF-2-like n=1 Tax=Echinops telfairi TaxID=9371 RepID=A0ABM1VMP9_ECHTE|nr:translation initiation factor IF-2-like [Echinops telfairi]